MTSLLGFKNRPTNLVVEICKDGADWLEDVLGGYGVIIADVPLVEQLDAGRVIGDDVTELFVFRGGDDGRDWAVPILLSQENLPTKVT